jgi:hypothetical protein
MKKIFKTLMISCFLITLFGNELRAHASGPPTHFPLNEYGDAVPWKKAEQLLPRGAIFTVIDKETGFYFKVQRRAGSSHADVQPLSYGDTAVLKHLYNGKWSWRRRAILIPVNDRLIAASMHGMPHGRGSLPNGFPGHFCIHFHGSRTHKKENLDPSHQLMVYKAAGKLEEYAANATPDQLIIMFLAGLKQQDRAIVRLTLTPKLQSYMTISDYINGIEALHYELVKKETRYPPFVKTSGAAKIKMHRSNKPVLRGTLIFTLKRSSITSGWKITKISQK